MHLYLYCVSNILVGIYWLLWVNKVGTPPSTAVYAAFIPSTAAALRYTYVVTCHSIWFDWAIGFSRFQVQQNCFYFMVMKEYLVYQMTTLIYHFVVSGIFMVEPDN